MDKESPETSELKHELANAEQQKLALQNLLGKAADQIEQVVEADCEDQAKGEAMAAVSKFRRAASL